jgi:malate dehydrogenase (oxaloacetate-decarboxylating)(NADP+)
VVKAYGGQPYSFGADYLIPRPFDPRLILEIAPAVAKAAMDSGVARRPIGDFEAYRERLNQFVFRSGLLMKPVFERAREESKRIFFAEGEAERVLRAAQILVDEQLGRPILCGRPEVVERRLAELGLRIRPGREFDLVNPLDDPRYRDYWSEYHDLTQRHGVSPDEARTIIRTNATAIGCIAVHRGDADALICGVEGRYQRHLRQVEATIGLAPGARDFSALSVLVTARGTLFIADTQVSAEPDAEEVVEMARLGAEAVRRFGIEPKIALLSHSNFGSHDDPSAAKMRHALKLIHQRHPQLEAEGEMHADAALSEEIRSRMFPNSRLSGAANLLIMPSVDAANIAFNLLKIAGEGLPVGPLLLGAAAPVAILTPSVTARGVVNASAIVAVDAQSRRRSVAPPEPPLRSVETGSA